MFERARNRGLGVAAGCLSASIFYVIAFGIAWLIRQAIR